MEKKQALINLYNKYLNNQASVEEITELFQNIDNASESEMEDLADVAFLKDIDTSDPTEDEQERLNRIYQGVIGRRREGHYLLKRIKPLIKYGIAASILFAIGLTFYFNNTKLEPHIEQSWMKNDVKPGGNKAVLTLADGSTIDLRDNQNGIIIGSEDIKYADGTHVIPTEMEKSVRLLSLTTPKGGQYQITLSDGTKVWLNAASTLKYPARFGKQRQVELSGEAYFEVAKNTKQPFIVTSASQEVTVLGTHFNINAYVDESNTRTTLMEGSIQVSNLSPTTPVILTPGQQSIINNNDIQVKAVDLDEAIAWQKGYFLFANENIKSIMRKVARWYDVEVVYEGDVENKAIGGTVSRYENVSEVLTMLSNTKAMKFKMDGNTIIVSPYK